MFSLLRYSVLIGPSVYSMYDQLTQELSLKLFSGSGTLEVPMSEVQLPIQLYHFRKSSGGIVCPDKRRWAVLS